VARTTQDAHCPTRKVTFVFYCAPLDDGNPMYKLVYGTDASHKGITDSAPYLTHLPYVLIDADTNDVISPTDSSNGKTATFPAKVHLAGSSLRDGTRWTHTLGPINIPDSVTRIALHIANDAYQDRRNFQLFPWTVPQAAHSKVHIYELRSDLQSTFADQNHLDNLADNTLAAKPGAADEYFGYLNGDLWLSLSHEFTSDEITSLCPPQSLSRTVLQGQTTGQQTTEQRAVDWATVLAPIYASGAGSRSMDRFSVTIDQLGITVTFANRALANAINTSNRTTVQQALSRTSPRTFAAILTAAWRLHIDTVMLSSSWRPMLGSILHKMGVGLDLTEFVDSAENIDFLVHNHGAQDRNRPFPQTTGGQKLAALYAELTGESEVSGQEVYTPWVHWVVPHDTHMHITVKR
jgi:hypothetical protein